MDIDISSPAWVANTLPVHLPVECLEHRREGTLPSQEPDVCQSILHCRLLPFHDGVQVRM